ARYELRPAPRRNDPEEDLRAAEVAHRGRERPLSAVERDLHTAAEAGAVDRRHRRVRQRAEAPEQLVARTASLDRQLAVRVRKLGDVRARREDERLPGQDKRRPVAVFELA